MNYTENLTQILNQAYQQAMSMSHSLITSHHLLKAILDDGNYDEVFEKSKINKPQLSQKLNSVLNQQPKTEGAQITLSNDAQTSLQNANQYAIENNDTFISVYALIVGIYKGSFDFIGSQDLNNIENAISEIRNGKNFNSESSENELNALLKYGRDLVKEVRDGKIDPIIGRDDEIRRIIQILSRKTKNNPVLIGEPELERLHRGRFSLAYNARRCSV